MMKWISPVLQAITRKRGVPTTDDEIKVVNFESKTLWADVAGSSTQDHYYKAHCLDLSELNEPDTVNTLLFYVSFNRNAFGINRLLSSEYLLRDSELSIPEVKFIENVAPSETFFVLAVQDDLMIRSGCMRCVRDDTGKCIKAIRSEGGLVKHFVSKRLLWPLIEALDW